MLHKVHRRLALLCAGITLTVLIALSACCLAISENSLKQSSFSSFRNDMNTLLGNLENQTVLSHNWLSRMEANGKYLIRVTDNGVGFLWGAQEHDPGREELLQAGLDYYISTFPAVSPARGTLYHTEYSFSFSRNDYYGCFAVSNRRGSTLTVLVLKPLENLHSRILRQRYYFLFPVMAASVLLSFFSWYFTGRLLRPVEESRRSQLAFVAAASHELRTPLAVILSSVSSCRRSEGAQQERFLSIMEEEGQHMSRLVSDLLQLAGTDSQNLSLTPSLCEPDTLLLTVFEAFEPLAEEKGFHLSIQLPEETVFPISCDDGRIRQVLSILLHNAFSYTPSGSRIRLSLLQQDRRTSFQVTDHGPGVPDELKGRIFERFFRGSQERRKDGHFGLGLSIAAQIMEAHGGSITVSDTPGGGATFTLILPEAGERSGPGRRKTGARAVGPRKKPPDKGRLEPMTF